MTNQIIVERSLLDTGLKSYLSAKSITPLPTDGSQLEIMTLFFKHKPFLMIVPEQEKYYELCKNLSDAEIDHGIVMITHGSTDSSSPRITKVRNGDREGLLSVIDSLLVEQVSKLEGFNMQFDNYADNYIYDILGQLGFRLKTMGTKYLHDVLKEMYNGKFDSTALVTKDIYPYVAKRYNTTPGAIERNIRTAIVHYWDNEKSCKYLGAIALPLAENNITPGNKETINYISSRIVPELNAKKAEMRKEYLKNL